MPWNSVMFTERQTDREKGELELELELAEEIKKHPNGRRELRVKPSGRF